jgi:transcriptional regulator with XRE-family HTH domain
MLYGAQLRAGRALLGWRQEDLADKAGVGLATLQRIERADGPVSGNAKTIWRLQTALEKEGIRFIGGESHDPVIGVTRAVS